MYLGEYGMDITDNPNTKIYTNDMKTFTNHNGNIIPTDCKRGECMESYAVCLNSPWSQTCETWTVEVNCKDSYTEIDENEPTFRCIYEVIGYDTIRSTIYGYGNTQQEALQNCINNFEYIQKTYNPDDECF